jgi:hypothetical protein
MPVEPVTVPKSARFAATAEPAMRTLANANRSVAAGDGFRCM